MIKRTLSALSVSALFGLVLGACAPQSSETPERSDDSPADVPRFPTYQTKDLNGKNLTLPDDFEGDFNLLFVAYERWHQPSVDSWSPYAERLEADFLGLRYYELPVVGETGFVGRTMLDYWMRQGIPSEEVRSRTLTLYVDREEFRDQVGIIDRDQIAIVLIDQGNRVVWRGIGPYDTELAEDLETTVTALARATQT